MTKPNENKTGYCNPPQHTRFSSTNQPTKNGRHKGMSPSDWLRKLAKTKIDFQNPLTGKVENMPIAAVVAIQLILKATQDGDIKAIQEFFNRIDGKVADVVNVNELEQELIDEEIEFTGLSKPGDGNGRFKRFYN